MNSRLPPLNSLRAFEVAARLLSVTKAAAEMNVTPSAISHHIKALETYYGVSLFNTSRRKLKLTEAGRNFLPRLSEGFNRLVAASNALHDLRSDRSLTVVVSGSLAVKWLVPRLPKFNHHFPDLAVRVVAQNLMHDRTEKDLNSGDVDVVIRFGPGHYPGYFVQRLMSDDVFPVCSPKIVTKRKPLSSPTDLRHHPLIHDEGYMHYKEESLRFHTTFPDWRMWCDAAGVGMSELPRGPTFTTSAMAVQAALDGQGVVLGRSSMVFDDLTAGRLIKPFDLSITNLFAYYCICLESSAKRPEVMAFQDWLREIASATQNAAILN